MAGAVVVAAVMEDFEDQPRKKTRKDGDISSVRTITNYFMPKPVEKQFSLSRSNNIMDYFKKPGKDIKSCSLVATQNSSQITEQLSSKPTKGQGMKRTGKTKDQEKSGKEFAAEVSEDVILIDTTVDTTAKENETPDISAQACHEGIESCSSKNISEIDPNKLEASEQTHRLNQTKKKDSVVNKSSVKRNQKLKGCGEIKDCNRDAKEPLKKDVGLEETIDEKSSTVTISFEDFMHNQSQELEESDGILNTSELLNEGPCNSPIGPLQVSPRTLTIQAEVHPISTECIKDSKELRVAAIFSRNKKNLLNADKSLSDAIPSAKPEALPEFKRKSNVVLLEEDLELDVLESSSLLKSTEVERKQFMSAFKQPSLEGFKNKTIKGQSKMNEVQDKVPESEDSGEKEKDGKSVEEKSEDPKLEQKELTSQKKKLAQKGGKQTEAKKGDKSGIKADGKVKLGMKNDGKVKKAADESGIKTDEKIKAAANKLRKKAKNKQVKKADAESLKKGADTEDLALEKKLEMEDVPVKNDEPENPVRELRRSTREISQKHSTTLVTSSPQKKELKNNESPSFTPKAQRPKRGVYKAEIICPPDAKGSPIRMKIRRVFPSSATEPGDFEISSPLSAKEMNAVKKRKQAHKLVQKTKALKQSKKGSKEKESLRRSTRSKESFVNYCENEDSLVFLEESEVALADSQETDKNHKLRSLNEVLGKNSSQNKTTKTSSASKLAPLFLEKKPQRASVVISIFDDNSREASENSQDDEQFRAKREFLKSGLPETFIKQMAKTAANREAYSQACASFQTVVHIQQKAPDCSVWNLQWPTHPFLKCLSAFSSLPTIPLMHLEKDFGCSTVPAKRAFNEKISCQKSTFPKETRQQLLEDLRMSNPSFPHQRFFSKFVKRYKEHVLLASRKDPEEKSKRALHPDSSDTLGKKRKRVDEGEALGKRGKKAKSSQCDDDVILVEERSPTGAQTAMGVSDSVDSDRTQRSRSQRKKQLDSAQLSSLVEMENDDLIIVDPPALACTSIEDGVKEDMLWTEKYQPQHSSEVIGNMESVRRLHSWLKEWKLRADRDEKQTQQEKKQDGDSNDSWLLSEGLEEAEDLCNTLLITGQTGVGKTAAVYACAQELGFKVFEVNSSSQRSGRHILSQLKEATQSHQVDIQGINALKPAYFSSYSNANTSIKPGTSPRKVNSPRRVVSSPRKTPQSPRSASSRRGGLVPTSLASFFKAGGRSTGKEGTCRDKKSLPDTCLKKTAKGSDSKIQDSQNTTQIDNNVSAEDQGKRTATSLILFEEVDVIFDEDSGFLAAIKTFMSTTKRPVILTTSDSSFADSFDGHFEEIHFKTPSVADVSSYLQLLCMAENMRTDTKDVSSLLDSNACDIRQSLLQLQFWGCSSRGPREPGSLPSSGAKGKAKSGSNHQSEKAQDAGDILPLCHTVFTESLLGISDMKLTDMLLKDDSSSLESFKSWEILSEVHRRRVNLLYSNMECLLPLPTRLLPQSCQQVPNPHSKTEQTSQHIRLESLEEPSDDASPLKVSCRSMGRKKKAQKDVFDSDSEEDFLSLPKPSRDSGQISVKTNPSVSEDAPKKPKRVVLSEAERKKSQPVMQCLSGIAEFMENMSFLESLLLHQPLQGEGSCRPHDIGWAGASVKSGMTDDVRLESVHQMKGAGLEDVQAILGHLSFRKCKSIVCEAWDHTQNLEEEIRREAEEELTLPVAPHRNTFSLTETSPCAPSDVESRTEVMKSVLFTGASGTLGNPAAVALDYLPTLRTICRSERLKEQGKTKRRFLHYLDGIHFTLPKSTVDILASEFP